MAWVFSQLVDVTEDPATGAFYARMVFTDNGHERCESIKFDHQPTVPELNAERIRIRDLLNAPDPDTQDRRRAVRIAQLKAFIVARGFVLPEGSDE